MHNSHLFGSEWMCWRERIFESHLFFNDLCPLFSDKGAQDLRGIFIVIIRHKNVVNIVRRVDKNQSILAPYRQIWVADCTK